VRFFKQRASIAGSIKMYQITTNIPNGHEVSIPRAIKIDKFMAKIF
jgi:hypothetical protein